MAAREHFVKTGCVSCVVLRGWWMGLRTRLDFSLQGSFQRGHKVHLERVHCAEEVAVDCRC